MKKFLIVLTVLFAASSVYAANDLSVGFSIGLVPNMCDMGKTILKDGAVGLSDDSLSSSIGMGNLIWADNEMGIILNNAEGTTVVPLQFLEDQQEGGPMNGLNFELSVMYDFTSMLGLPLFARLGFNYAFAFNGVTQKITLGDGVDQYAMLNGFPLPTDGTYSGSSAELAWHASWWDIPITIGLVLPIADKGKIYGGFGLTWISGGWGIDAKFDGNYCAMLTSYQGQAAPLTEQSVNTTIDFTSSYITLHFMFGMEVNVAAGVAVTFEYWMTAAARNVFTTDGFDNRTSQTMTGAIYGPTAYSLDPNAVEDFAYPAVVGGSFIKLGVKYYIPL
jgi:hypothetical protein